MRVGLVGLALVAATLPFTSVAGAEGCFLTLDSDGNGLTIASPGSVDGPQRSWCTGDADCGGYGLDLEEGPLDHGSCTPA